MVSSAGLARGRPIGYNRRDTQNFWLVWLAAFVDGSMWEPNRDLALTLLGRQAIFCGRTSFSERDDPAATAPCRLFPEPGIWQGSLSLCRRSRCSTPLR